MMTNTKQSHGRTLRYGTSLTVGKLSEIQERVQRWMVAELQLSLDTYLDCGEVNTTILGEHAAQALELYEDDAEATIPEWVFELSHDVSTWWESGPERARA